MYQKDDLRKWTDIYWSETGEHAKNYYLGPLEGFDSHKRPPRPLLYLEMECAKANGYLPKRDDRPITLAFLVGDSFEPLLQSICAYKPARLVPVVNAYYGDREPQQRKKGWKQWRDLRELINRLTVEFKPPSALLEPGQLKTVCFQEDGTDAPIAVFNFLRQELQEDLADSKRRVVVDITGAKKTMVVGAFLFAAYTNADIAYVDFDAYDPERGKPYGFTCRFITVDNPLNHFALQEWERIAQLYEQHDFSGALALLPTELPVSLGEWNKQLDQLRQFLEVCAFWENGQLHQGNSTQGSLPGHLRQLVPSSIALLGDYWPSPDKGYESWVAKEFLLDPHAW